MDIMKKKLSSMARGIAECPKKAFAILMGVMSAYCWQLFTLFTTWFGIHTKLPLRVFIPNFQTLVFCTPVLMLLWCYWTNCALKKKGGRAKLTGFAFLILLLCIVFARISATGKVGGVWFWIISVVISLVLSLVILKMFLRKPHRRVSATDEEHEEGSEEEEPSEEGEEPEEEEDP